MPVAVVRQQRRRDRAPGRKGHEQQPWNTHHFSQYFFLHIIPLYLVFDWSGRSTSGCDVETLWLLNAGRVKRLQFFEHWFTARCVRGTEDTEGLFITIKIEKRSRGYIFFISLRSVKKMSGKFHGTRIFTDLHGLPEHLCFFWSIVEDKKICVIRVPKKYFK